MMAQFTPPDSVKENKNKLSVITINYNNRDGLLRTIKSVAEQTCRDFEYIVIDGGSTDGSVDVIKEYVDYIDYWISEPDKGIYNAMNKGTATANGEYCLYLNSGDCFYDDKVVEYFVKSASTADLVLGKTEIQHIDGTSIISRQITGDITFFSLYKSCIIHQSLFIRTSVIKRIGYDESYKICSDWKFILIAVILENASFDTVDFVVSKYVEDGISALNPDKLWAEKRQILKELFNFPVRVLNDYDNMSVEMYDLSKRMKKYHGFNRFIVGLDKILIRCYSIIKS